MSEQLFNLGQQVMTRGVAALMSEDNAFAAEVSRSLARHKAGDFGDLSAEDLKENKFALKRQFRILSAYEIKPKKIWIITEADRSVTTILFPSEY